MILTIVGWLVWAVIGLLVGLAAAAVPRARQGVVNDMLVGAVGALVGGLVFDLLVPVPTITDLNPWNTLGALTGALALVFLFRLLNWRAVKTITRTEDDASAHVTEVRRDHIDVSGPYLMLRGRRVHWAVPVALLVLLPLLHLGLLWLRYPDISAQPPRFGEIASYQNPYGQLDYLVYAPPSAQEAAPLLLLLHGCTQDPYTLDSASGMRELADVNGFVLVYPQQNFLSSPHRCWNWYAERNQARDSGEPSLLTGIVGQVQGTHSIDPARLYVAGISSGGAMTSTVASCYADTFAAAAVHSGMAYQSANGIVQALIAPFQGSQTPPAEAGQAAYACSGEPARPIPVIELHGTQDNTVLPVNSPDVVEQFAQLNDLADDGEDNNSVSSVPTSAEPGQPQDAGDFNYTVETTQVGDTALLQRVVVDGLTHMWAGGTGVYPLSDPRAPNASQLFWTFLSGHRL